MMSPKPFPWLVEWEEPKKVLRICPRHFEPSHFDPAGGLQGEPCPLSEFEPFVTMTARPFEKCDEAWAFAEAKAHEEYVGMVSITERQVEEDAFAPGLWDITDIAAWYYTVSGEFEGGRL